MKENDTVANEIEETVTSTKRIYDGRIINLRLDTVLMPDGKMSQREIVEHRGAVALVPLFADKTVVMVRQFRRPAAAALLEIPAGTRDAQEDIEVTARRELAEEVNLSAGRLVKLFHAYVAPGYSTEVIHIYLALDLTPTDGNTDEDEFLEVVRLPLDEALDKIASGEIIDSKSISALLFVARLLPTLNL
jgi:ADP-ribose pyrophosphatase